MIWRLLGTGVLGLGVAAGAIIPAVVLDGGETTEVARRRVIIPEPPVQHGAWLQDADPHDELEALLEGVRGAGPVACGLALLALDGFGYGGPQVRADIEVSPGSPLTTRALARWVSHPPRDPGLVPRLRTALADGDSCVRRAAARLLGRNRTDLAVVALLETLRTSDLLGRRSAALALGVAGRPSTAPVLRERLSDPDPGVRAAAAWALGELSDRASVPSLIGVLGADEDPVARKLAAWALGEIQ